MIVDIHADDYGYSLNTSKELLKLMKLGKLNSISLICNTSYFNDSVDLLYENIKELPFMPKISVHLNLVEGFFENNKLPMSWSKLFFYSYIPSGIKNILKNEIKKQIELYIDVLNNIKDYCKKYDVEFNQNSIRIDSHTHTHLIPIVWKSLIEVINENNYEIEYIRNPKEPIKPFIEAINNVDFSKVNFIKNIILNIYSSKVDKYCIRNNMPLMYMWGLVMSGKMDKKRIDMFYDQMLEISKNDNRNLEILFHPGIALKNEYMSEMNKDYFNDFNSSNNREIEKDAVMNI